MAFGHFLLGSHNFTVMALGSCEVALSFHIGKWGMLVSQVSNFADMSIPDWIQGGTPTTHDPTLSVTTTSNKG